MPSAASKAATPPIGKPYPSCMSGIASDAPTMPGRCATLHTCSRERSPRMAASSLSLAKTRAGTRIPPVGATSQTPGPTRSRSLLTRPI